MKRSPLTPLILCTAALVLALLYWYSLRRWVDPQPLGPRQHTASLTPQPLDPPLLEWLPLTPPRDFTLTLTAAHQQGERDVLYGLVWGAPDHYLVVAISPLGYVAIFEVQAGEERPLLPYQPSSLVRGGAQRNEWWLTVAEGQVTVRLNRELLWQGQTHIARGRVGWMGRSFEGAAVVDYQEMQLFYNVDGRD